MDTLTPLLDEIFPYSEIARGMELKRTKQPRLKRKILAICKSQENYFPETTDISVKKTMCMWHSQWFI
nr:unnamed protein product [Callosobruchus analis]